MNTGIASSETVHDAGGMSVSVSRCASYEREAVKSAVATAVDQLGGISRFVKDGERILLKPNMLSPKAPASAVTTHPEVVRAMIELVREAGGTAVVGDTPGGMSSERTLRNLAKATGIWSVCEEEGAEFVFLLEADRFPHPAGKVAKSFELASILHEVDGVISLPKLKTHTLTGLTVAVKNLFGLVPGIRKSGYHARMQDAGPFSEMLVDLAECVRPRLTVVDAVVGMDGDGPAAGDPFSIGLIIAGANPHSVDAFVMDLVRADPGRVPTVRIARERGLIQTGDSSIGIVGGTLSELQVRNFRMPGETTLRGRLLSGLSKTYGTVGSRKPVFSRSKCTMCGKCIEVCPGRALRKGKEKPLIDRDLCIRCYCCQEMCPDNAIALKRIPARSIYGVTIGRARNVVRGKAKT